MIRLFLITLVLSIPVLALTPPEVWAQYDPDHGEYKEELIAESTTNGVYARETYISAYVNEVEIRVYCKYQVKEELRGKKHQAPALMDVHGWMGRPAPSSEHVEAGWAVMSHDYCGQSNGRPHYTKYPEKMKYCNMDGAHGGGVWSHRADRSSITDYRETSDYAWYAIQRRVLSYLLSQQEADPARVGARGYSYGGTLMWNLAMDSRVKAVVAYFGIGFLEYYRTNSVWLYNNPYHEPAKSPGQELYLSTLAPQAHAPYIKAACMWLNGTNDHHGGHERGEHMFHKFAKTTPWNYALVARGHHSTDGIKQNDLMWLNSHVLGHKIDWADRPKSEVKLNSEGVPEYHLTPGSPAQVKEVKAYYAVKSPVSFARSWRDAELRRVGDSWVASMPVINVDDYVFGFCHLTYTNGTAISSDFEAVIPSKIGQAVATDQLSNTISEGTGTWSKVGPAEGPGGIKGFRPLNNHHGASNQQFSDPKYQAPKGAELHFQFYCTQPQTIELKTGNRCVATVEITASDDWQELSLPAGKFTSTHNKQPMQSYDGMKSLKIMPVKGADLTKIIFANFQWK